MIRNDNKLDVESFISEKRWIAKSKNTKEYLINLHFDSFNEINEIRGSTVNLKNNRKFTLTNSAINTFDAEQEDIFKSDAKLKQFSLPAVEDNSEIEYSYHNILKQPRFLSIFRFQNPLHTDVARLQIKCDPSIEIGFKLFGNYQDKISFTKTKEDQLDLYTWEAKGIPEFEPEEAMCSPLYYTPHIVYYVKNYQVDGKKEELLGKPENLYKWYMSLIKDINKTDQSKLKNKTLELIQGKNSDFDKAEAIYYWVQKSLHYVAFENGMGGFIPREAAEVYDKLYGDCKDMANILNEMLRYAKLNSNLAWIGTRHKPYTYEEVPTPQVDNHMITNLQIDGKSYFLDATDKFCPFSYPSAMIQGKEAMIAKTENDFKIETVPQVSAQDNKVGITMQLKLAEKEIVGEASVRISGLQKSELLNNLSSFPQKENEIWKATLNESNTKILLEPQNLEGNAYQKQAASAHFKLKLEGAVKDINGKLLLKPLFITPHKETLIDLEKRKLSIENDFAHDIEITYEYEIPEGYKIEFLPENSQSENELLRFEFQYKTLNNKITITQKTALKVLLIDNKDFVQWNTIIKNLNKQYNQSIILTP